MTPDLSDFGGGVDQPEAESDDEQAESSDTRYQYNAGRCRGITTDGQRCRSSASEGELCYIHGQENDPITIDADPVRLIEATSRTVFEDLDDRDVDAELIRAVVHNLVGLEDKPLTVSEDGLWLPKRFAEADRLIIRAPTKTADTHLKGSATRPRVTPTVDASAWDEDYLDGKERTAEIRNERCLPDGDGPMVGLKIAGEDQRWFPIELPGGESA